MKTLFFNLGLMIALAAPVMAANQYSVHEWGTFTSVQGGDGKLQWWHPLATSQLPGFVYNWFNPGLNLIPSAMQGGGKGGFPALQRLETPIDYFYSDVPMNVDVNVRFPKGFITEWYPLASQIGPSKAYPRATAAQKFTSPLDASVEESRVTWNCLTILPPRSMAPTLPTDQAGSHYFAARDTDADYVRTELPDPVTGTNELEKFLFYRGAGTFATPLYVGMDEADRFALGNNGPEKLSNLFLVQIRAGYGEFTCVNTLPPGQTNWVAGPEAASEGWQRYPLAQFKDAIASEMVAALVHEGLFPREAKAMVNTWRDSWFTEEGTRVLYLLPRTWTDGVLPMTLNPQPRELVRVMVGRAEIISPRLQTELLDNLKRASDGDPAARQAASQTFKSLGRFAQPALALALGNDYTNAVAQLGGQLMMQAMIQATISKN